MNMKSFKLAVCAAALTAGFGMLTSSQASAQAAVMKECATEFSAAKAAGTLGGKTWPGYLADCKLRKEAPATPAAAPAPAPVKPPPPIVAAPKPAPLPAPVAPAPTATKVTPAAPATLPPIATAPAPGIAPAPTGTPGQQAFHEREVKCGAYWRANKDALRAQTPGIKWPQFLSKCNAELKAAGQ
jgi:hypothetical protein